MLCVISIQASLNGNAVNKFVIEVPDELFMRHMMMYGEFKPEQLSDSEFRDCALLGLRDSIQYVGPADDNNQRKDKP